MSKPYSSNKHSLEYLIKNNRLPLDDNEFLDTHLIYRGKPDKNPIDLAYPNSIITELSCNWSKFIIAGDTIRLRPEKDKFIFYTTIKKLKEFKVEWNKNDGSGYDGEHVLTCCLYHAPLDSNYSHAQIDIVHQVNCVNPQLSETRRYVRANWKKGANLFRKKENEDIKRFFKDLKAEYKFQLAQQFDELPVDEHFLYDDEFIKDNSSFVANNESSTFHTSIINQSSTNFKSVNVPQLAVSPNSTTNSKNNFWDLLKFVQENSSNLKSKLLEGIANIFRKK